MKKYLVLILLALVAMTGAVFEGLIELSPRLIQVNGLMTIVFTAALIIWTLKVQIDDVSEG